MFNWLRRYTRRWLAYEDGLAYNLAQSPTLSGLHLDEQSCLGLTAVYCAVTTISSLIAGLPLCLYQINNKDKREAVEHPLYDLLRHSPNAELTKEQHWQTVVAHVLLYGNSYQEIERDESGRPVALWILPPERVKVGRDAELGLFYEVQLTSGSNIYLRPDQCFHVSGLSHDGLNGFSPVRLARETLALTQACERFGASFFGNSARPSGVLQSPLALSQNARENLRKSWENLYSGTTNVGRTAILEEGVQFTPISIPAEDAQFIETRGYQINEVARIFNISPVFLHDLGRATWSNLETLNRQLVQVTLLPWMQKIEAQVRLKLIGTERTGYFAEHDVSNLLRADTLTRYQAYQVAINSGWMLRSEARANERLDPIPNLDVPTLPLNVGQQDQENNGTSSLTS